MNRHPSLVRRLIIAALATLTLTCGFAGAASSAVAAPKWALRSEANTAVAPGGTILYSVFVANVGDVESEPGACPGPECQALTATFPAGQLEPQKPSGSGWSCTVSAPSVTCTRTTAVPPTMAPNNTPSLTLKAKAEPEASGSAVVQIEMGGGGAGELATTVDATEITADPTPFGIDSFDGQISDASGTPYTRAGGSPDSITTQIDFNRIDNPTNPFVGGPWPVEPVRNTFVDLPPGLLGNPTVAASCTAVQLANTSGVTPEPLCPPASQVGVAAIAFTLGVGGSAGLQNPAALYNLVPPPGVLARFGFNIAGTMIILDAQVRSDGDYGVTVGSRGISKGLAVVGTEVTFWGTPAASSHDALRSCPGVSEVLNGGPSCKAGIDPQAFLRLPTTCAGPQATSLLADSYANPGAFGRNGRPDTSDPNWTHASFVSHEPPNYPYPAGQRGAPIGIESCENVPFTPEVVVSPTSNRADSPSGLDVTLDIPQGGITEPNSTAQSALRDVTVTLPAGMSVNPASATGLGACTPEQVGMSSAVSATPVSFTNQPASCPDSSKVGQVEVKTPLLDHSLEGSVYLAKQSDNPFGSLLALYLVAEDRQTGIVLKLAGKVDSDASTGQLTTTFHDQPQLPFEHLHLELFGGQRAALRTPSACGTHATETTLTPWSGNPPVDVSSSFSITEGCNGDFDPKLSAGTTNPLAGTTSPFTLRLTREDGTQELGGLQATMPPGLSGYLKGIPYCPDSALASVSGDEGTGNGQIASPSCPAASQVGTVTVGAGAGSTPFYTSAGRAYLAGPYRGAPLSLAVVAPAVAGPFDLGSVVVRNALRVNPETAQITAVSDPLPSILHGIPLDLRDVRVELDRPNFTLNPTSCDEMQIASTVTSTQGASASPSQRFQVAGCEELAFKPKLSLRLKGGTKRSKHPALRAELNARPGDANIGKVVVAMPHSEFLAQSHIRTICTRVQYAANACPAGSVYGHARAFSPLLDQPLEGPVYLRSSSNPLPDLVAALHGQIDIELSGRIDSKDGGIRTTFDVVPDAPVTKFVLTMQGGKKGLLENSTNICRTKHRATVQMDGQNGKVNDFRPLLKAQCGKKTKRHKRPGR